MGRILRKPGKNGKKYTMLASAMTDVLFDYAQNMMTPRELHAKYLPLCEKPFTVGSLKCFIDRKGGSALRAKVKEKLKDGKVTASLGRSRERLSDQALEVVADDIAKRIADGKAIHQSRMIANTDKIFKVLDKSKPTQKNVGFFIDNLSRADNIARKLYRLDDDKPVNATSLQVAILVNLAKDE